VRLFWRRFRSIRCRKCKLPVSGWFIKKCKCDWKDLLSSYVGIGYYVKARQLWKQRVFEVPRGCLMVMDERRGLGNRTPIISGY
jgi:hypothetical protein